MKTIDAGSNPLTTGQRVVNPYGETGKVVSVQENNVLVQPDKHTGSPENWHITKTYPVK